MLVAAIALLLGAVPAFAAVPRDGWGFGLTDPDVEVGRSLDHDFATLDAKTFRILLPWDVVDHPDQLSQAAERMQLARAAGVEEIVVSFGPASGWAEGAWPVLGEKYRPTPELWISKVRRFVELHDADVDVWGPANEPNEGVGWLRDGEGPAKLAGYYAELYRLIKVERAAGGDRLLSPEFHDHLDGTGTPWPADPSRYPADYSTLDRYIDAYEGHVQGLGVGDGFGDYVGWHPYKGTRLQSRAGTDDLIGAIPAGRPVWITETGAVIHTAVAAQTEAEQEADVDWLVNSASGLARHDRVERIYYWHMRNHNPGWDSAFVDDSGRRRPAWYTWCAASHGDDPLHTDCGRYVPLFGFPDGGVRADPVLLRRSSASWPAGSFQQYLADVTGDGQDDVVYYSAAAGGAWHVSSSSGGGFEPPALWATLVGPGSASRFVADVNGDGRDDLVLYYPNEANGTWRVALSSGAGFHPPGVWAFGAGAGSASQFMADVDADGRDDVVLYNPGEANGTWRVARSSVGGFALPEVWASGVGPGSTRQFMADVTGDARDDVVLYTEGEENGTWRVAASFGGGFHQPGVWATGAPGLNDQLLADVTGDGREDAILIDWSCHCWRAMRSSGAGFEPPAASRAGSLRTSRPGP